MTDPRHRQLSRIYQRTIENDEDARAATAEDPGVLASALFLEAVESDDVTSVGSARVYLADRLGYLGRLITDPSRVQEAFERKLEAWQ